MAVKILLACIVLGALALWGCGSGDGAEGTTVGGGTSSEALAPPGLYELDDGSVQALGLLTFREIEGGVWAVVDTFEPKEAATAAVVAVVLPDSAIGPVLTSHRDEYVSVIGELDEGPTIYQAGPVVRATSIDRVEEQVVE